MSPAMVLAQALLRKAKAEFVIAGLSPDHVARPSQGTAPREVIRWLGWLKDSLPRATAHCAAAVRRERFAYAAAHSAYVSDGLFAPGCGDFLSLRETLEALREAEVFCEAMRAVAESDIGMELRTYLKAGCEAALVSIDPRQHAGSGG